MQRAHVILSLGVLLWTALAGCSSSPAPDAKQAIEVPPKAPAQVTTQEKGTPTPPTAKGADQEVPGNDPSPQPKRENKIWPIRLHKPDLAKTEKLLADPNSGMGDASNEVFAAARKLTEQVMAAEGAERQALEERWNYLLMAVKLEANQPLDLDELSKPMAAALEGQDYAEFNRLANCVNAYRLCYNAAELFVDASEVARMGKMLKEEVKPAKAAGDQFSPLEKMQKILDAGLSGK